jgi:hypothetical protein
MQTWGYLVLGVVGVAAGASYHALLHRGSEAAASYRQEASWWKARMDALGPTIDVDDDGHLFEWFDVPEWEQIFALLEELPPGSRSLRSAIESVAPDALNLSDGV